MSSDLWERPKKLTPEELAAAAQEALERPK
jgi:hypothetical protein